MDMTKAQNGLETDLKKIAGKRYFGHKNSQYSEHMT